MENANKDDEIKKDLERIKQSIDEMDLNALSENIGITVNKALGHVARGVEYTAEQVSKGVDKWAESAKKASDLENEENCTEKNVEKDDSLTTRNPYSYTAQNPYYKKKQQNQIKKQSLCIPPKGKILGKISMFCGSLWAGLMGMMILMMIWIGIPELGLVLFLPLTVMGVWLAIWGNKKVKRYERYLCYIREMRGKPFVKIEGLARAIGKSVKFTIKDIREMLRDGVFPSGRLSEEEDYLLLTNEVYEEYVTARNEMRRKQREEKKSKEESIIEKEEVISSKETTEGKADLKTPSEEKTVDEKTKKVQETIRVGREYLRQIEEANDIIEAQDISEKLFRLQLLIDKIFYCVEQNPDKLPEIKQFMEYYLPTTLKLINAYRDFYLQPVQGENITAAKAEIEKAIDTINRGFENLLDDLFKQDALDITTDIFVLENMLAREGLTENEFEKMKSGGV